jgi:hypothetical protein
MVHAMLLSDTTARFNGWAPIEVVTHCSRFPFEVLGSTLPWSLLLLGYFRRDIYRWLGSACPQVLFVATCAAVAFPTCWLPPGGETRYFAPLYPCLAVLIGWIVEHATDLAAVPSVRVGWRYFVAFVFGVIILAALATVVVAFFLRDHPEYGAWAEPLPAAAVYASAACVTAILTFRALQDSSAGHVRLAVLTLAGFMVLTFRGPIDNAKIRRSSDQSGAIARLKELMPEGQRLVSLGHITSSFVYYYGRPIDMLPISASLSDIPAGAWFCFYYRGDAVPQLPFDWQEVARVPMDRNCHTPPLEVVVVGRPVNRPPSSSVISSAARHDIKATESGEPNESTL